MAAGCAAGDDAAAAGARLVSPATRAGADAVAGCHGGGVHRWPSSASERTLACRVLARLRACRASGALSGPDGRCRLAPVVSGVARLILAAGWLGEKKALDA